MVKKAANIPIDEDTEHESNAIKQGIRNIGPNVTKNAVQRIYFARRPTASILSNLNSCHQANTLMEIWKGT